MKKFILGMLFAHYLRLTGISPFLRLVLKNIIQRAIALEEETRPSVSEEREARAQKASEDQEELRKRVMEYHDAGYSNTWIASRLRIKESTVRMIVPELN